MTAEEAAKFCLARWHLEELEAVQRAKTIVAKSNCGDSTAVLDFCVAAKTLHAAAENLSRKLQILKPCDELDTQSKEKIDSIEFDENLDKDSIKLLVRDALAKNTCRGRDVYVTRTECWEDISGVVQISLFLKWQNTVRYDILLESKRALSYGAEDGIARVDIFGVQSSKSNYRFYLFCAASNDEHIDFAFKLQKLMEMLLEGSPLMEAKLFKKRKTTIVFLTLDALLGGFPQYCQHAFNDEVKDILDMNHEF